MDLGLNSNFIQKTLFTELAQRKTRNPNYSLRAFARSLELAPGTLCSVLQGKRVIPFQKAAIVCNHLQLKGKEKKKFLDTFQKSLTIEKKRSRRFRYERQVDDKRWQDIIADPIYFTTLSVFNLTNAKIEPYYLSQKLGLDLMSSKKILQNLHLAGLIKVENGYYILRAHSHNTRDNAPSECIKEAHRNSLKAAAEKLDSTDIDLRDYLSIKIPTNLEKLKIAKKEIRKFLVKMHKILSEGEKSEVYELSLQLFPRSTLKVTKND